MVKSWEVREDRVAASSVFFNFIDIILYYALSHCKEWSTIAPPGVYFENCRSSEFKLKRMKKELTITVVVLL